MLVWKHSKAEGGNTEYGTEFKENALDTLKEQLNERTELARKLENMLREGVSEDAALQAVKDAWTKITVWNVPLEKEIIKRYEKALNAFEPMMAEIKENAAAKSDLVAKAKNLLDAENFKNARNELEKIKNAYHEIGTIRAALTLTFPSIIIGTSAEYHSLVLQMELLFQLVSSDCESLKFLLLSWHCASFLR
jgi:hypothetical protein